MRIAEQELDDGALHGDGRGDLIGRRKRMVRSGRRAQQHAAGG